jgi:hypothetical protein
LLCGLLTGAALAVVVGYGFERASEREPLQRGVQYNDFRWVTAKLLDREDVILVVAEECSDCRTAIARLERSGLALKTFAADEFDARINGGNAWVAAMEAEKFPVLIASDRAIIGYEPQEYDDFERHYRSITMQKESGSASSARW